ncbi:substrate-binding periplasmic protein [Rheinheimera pleomorphica]|uniref:substrate-binding periplasmic protein n=1 Tax=Rheinheimera pleomorphica TaxID=2703963 RepID=UPI00141DBC6D|nr:ABC transporter substrate-binding protein [Rheinheimera pleomorphica]
MNGTIRLIFALLLTFSATPLALAAETTVSVRLLTEHSPPGQYLNAQGEVSGVTVELIKHVQRQLGESGTPELMPWGRALSIARNANNVALFETVRTAERESWFKWVGPLMHYSIKLYGLKHRLGIEATELSLPGKLIACSYRNAVTAQDIKRFGFTEGRNLILTSKSGECLDMLIYGRVDLMAITEYILPEYSKDVTRAGYELVAVRHLTERKRYLAFSPDVSDERIQRWQQALEQSYRDGTMRKLYQPVYAEPIIQRLEAFARKQHKRTPD